MGTKIILGICTYKYITSIAFGYHMGMLLDGVNCGLVKNLTIEADMYVTMARNNLCLTALHLHKEEGITHLLMVDDDMLIPNGAIAKLASNDVPVVGGAYYTRNLTPVAYDLEPFKFLDEIPSSGVIPIDGTGAGFLLISCELLLQMQDRYKDPWWFQSTVILGDDGRDKYLGEDVFFFRRLKEMGIQPYLDCDIQCGHAGTAIADRKAYEITRSPGFHERWIG